MTKRKSKTPSTVIWYDPTDLNDYGAMTFRFEVFKALQRREAELGFLSGLMAFYYRFDKMRLDLNKVGLMVKNAGTLYDYLTEQMGERFLMFERVPLPFQLRQACYEACHLGPAVGVDRAT
jgi:hypothetical protein